MKTAVVERDAVGGICLNWGCIPSKALLRNAEVLTLFNHSQEFGITFDNITYDFGKAIDRSRRVVRRLVKGVESLLKKNRVDHIKGEALLRSKDTVEIRGTGQTLTARSIITATGARPKELPTVPVDRQVVITSREALELRAVPSSLVIIGGGASGVEFAYLYRAYGSQVTVVEMLPRLVPLEDEEVSQQLERSFSKQGIKAMTSSQVASLSVKDGKARLTVSGPGGDKEIEADKVLVGVGVRGNIENLGLEGLGVETEGGFIKIDDHMRTNVPGVYAIGDVTGKLLLAHAASAQGLAAVETIAGLESPSLDYTFMPKATYCQPQIASFGFTEAQAKEQGFNVKVGKFPFMAIGKAVAMGETDGMVKLVVDSESGEILGAHMIGHDVTELLGELSLARLLEGTNHEVGWMVHSHPTLSEALKEAALAADGRAIHI